jgi:hypothetical protein
MNCWKKRRCHQKSHEYSSSESGFMIPIKRPKRTALAAVSALLGGHESKGIMQKKHGTVLKAA